jgi:hypothetical protein
VSTAFRLTEAERARRYDLLLQTSTPPEPPVLSGDGLRLLFYATTAPLIPEALPAHVRPEVDRLAAAGLVDGRGRLVAQAANIVDLMRKPAIRVGIEALTGKPSGAAWTAWLSEERAVIVAHPGATDDYTLLTAIPGWVPVAAFRWLDIGPRDTLTGSTELSMSDLLRWIDDPDTPPPGDNPVLARIWAQPGRLWGIDVEPADGRALLLDADEAGLWLVTAVDAEGGTGGALLTPLSPRALWRLLITFIARASEAASAGLTPRGGEGAVGADVPWPERVAKADPARRHEGLL